MSSWIVDALNPEDIRRAEGEAVKTRLSHAFGSHELLPGGLETDFVADVLELAVIDLLDDVGSTDTLREVSAQAFQLLRARPHEGTPLEMAAFHLHMACLAVIGDKGADAARLLKESGWPNLPLDTGMWGDRAFATVLEVWLRLIRKDGWGDLTAVERLVVDLKRHQAEFEEAYLRSRQGTRQAAWQLVAIYHAAHAAELLAKFTTQGSVDGKYDIRQLLEAQFDRALNACNEGGLADFEVLLRLLARAGTQMVDNSIWTVTRGAPSRTRNFVRSLVSQPRPIFEMLPPQRRAIREVGLLGAGRRSVVVNLPTSSGKTIIAEFRVLQALQQFQEDRGWVAYTAPTRALVNQVANRLRRDLSPLGVHVERVSPALEIDALEERLLTDEDPDARFDVLALTPEKLDLMIRGGWEKKIGRPLTLVVVDEAHTLAEGERGIKLEMLLATLNRDCSYAQFLLLTPFVPNADEIARWLDPEDYQSVSLSVNWQPNDRVVALSSAQRAGRPKEFSLVFQTLHTTRQTLSMVDPVRTPPGRPLGLALSNVRISAKKLAAATAEILTVKGPVIVLAASPSDAWDTAEVIRQGRDSVPDVTNELRLVQDYVSLEYGEDFVLRALLERKVGVHHGGLSDESRRLMEWLFERGEIDLLVATTTLAQGVNFPMSAVVLASHYYRYSTPPYHRPMPPADFWNLAGRVGRADQAQVGIVALAAKDETHADALRQFVGTQLVALHSNLVEMVTRAVKQWPDLPLERMSNEPEWSAFVQFLAHAYREIANTAQFTNEVEQILRGTLGFQELRRSRPELSDLLVRSVEAYGRRLAGKPISLVDSTGWSWESVSATLARLSEDRIGPDVWNPDALFESPNSGLATLMGILLQVPELRQNLEAAAGGRTPDGTKLARMVIDWVSGASLSEMAAEYFNQTPDGRARTKRDSLTECCRSIYGRLTQTASWGLAALQALTLGSSLEALGSSDQRTIKNIPARVFYGVNTNNAIALRLLGAPRAASEPLASILGQSIFDQSLPRIRSRLADPSGQIWTEALGSSGRMYFEVWKVLEGEQHARPST